MTDDTSPKIVKLYATKNGMEPYTEWLRSLKDYVVRARIVRRIERLEQGNYGDCKPVGEGVYELRFFFGSGYRVYFGESGDDIVILLCGGDKSSQDRDIEKAKEYWQAYQEEQQDEP